MKPGDMGRMGHRIDAISYALDVVECTCGEAGPAKGAAWWAEHRRSVGLGVPTVGQTIGKRLGGAALHRGGTLLHTSHQEAT